MATCAASSNGTSALSVSVWLRAARSVGEGIDLEAAMAAYTKAIELHPVQYAKRILASLASVTACNGAVAASRTDRAATTAPTSLRRERWAIVYSPCGPSRCWRRVA